jgi:hypothetical protein
MQPLEMGEHDPALERVAVHVGSVRHHVVGHSLLVIAREVGATSAARLAVPHGVSLPDRANGPATTVIDESEPRWTLAPRQLLLRRERRRRRPQQHPSFVDGGRSRTVNAEVVFGRPR